MRPRRVGRTADATGRRGFTLIELLVVLAIISVLMAVSLTAGYAVRSAARRIVCQRNLSQVTLAYNSFMTEENNNRFYEGDNHNFDYGGWEPQGSAPGPRPINKHLGLGSSSALTAGTAKVFRCPADKEVFFAQGNSYQANNILVCPTPLQVGSWVDPPWISDCNKRINQLLPVTRGRVNNPSQHLWIGDWYWYCQWDPLQPACFESWHERRHHHNMSFLDGHVAFVWIVRGLYLNVKEAYRVQPFKEADEFLCANQQVVDCPCGKP